MSAVTDLVVLPPKETALQVFQTEKGLDPFLAQIRKEIDDFVPDVSSRKGRDAVASIAYKIARSKTTLDNMGKDLVAELKEIPKKIDAERKRMRELLECWQEEVRKPLTEWEEADKARIESHKLVIAWLESHLDLSQETESAAVSALIEKVEAIEISPAFEEFESDVARAKDKALSALRQQLSQRVKYEGEQAELSELRRIQAEREAQDERDRIAREATAKAQREADAKAQAERDAAAKRERDLELQAERSKREAMESQQRAEQAERDATLRAEQAAAAERQRIAEEQAEIERQAKAREADQAHKQSVLTAAKEAVMLAGITEDQARSIINMIRKGEVPNVSISF
jgi:hypothetical protein